MKFHAHGWVSVCMWAQSYAKNSNMKTSPTATTTATAAAKKHTHSRWDNVMRHKSPSSFHFAGDERRQHTLTLPDIQFLWKIYPFSNGFSQSTPCTARAFACVYVCTMSVPLCTVHSDAHLMPLPFHFSFYFYFTSSHLVTSILKCFSVYNDTTQNARAQAAVTTRTRHRDDCGHMLYVFAHVNTEAESFVRHPYLIFFSSVVSLSLFHHSYCSHHYSLSRNVFRF